MTTTTEKQISLEAICPPNFSFTPTLARYLSKSISLSHPRTQSKRSDVIGKVQGVIDDDIMDRLTILVQMLLTVLCRSALAVWL